MSKYGESYLNNVPVLVFSGAILLMCMGTRNKMLYAYAPKKGIQGLIFTSPVCLYLQDLATKLSLDKVLKITKTREYF